MKKLWEQEKMLVTLELLSSHDIDLSNIGHVVKS